MVRGGNDVEKLLVPAMLLSEYNTPLLEYAWLRRRCSQGYNLSWFQPPAVYHAEYTAASKVASFWRSLLNTLRLGIPQPSKPPCRIDKSYVMLGMPQPSEHPASEVTPQRKCMD